MKYRRYCESLDLFEKIVSSKSNYRVSDCLVYITGICLISNKVDYAKEKINEAIQIDCNLFYDLNYQIIRAKLFHDTSNLTHLTLIFEQTNSNLSLFFKFSDLLLFFDQFDSIRRLLLKSSPQTTNSNEKG